MKRPFIVSLILTVLMTVWTSLIPVWEFKEWFIEKWLQRVWFSYDIILCILLAGLTIGVYLKLKAVKILAPTLFGMMLGDWTINILMVFHSNSLTFFSVQGFSILSLILIVCLFLFYTFSYLQKSAE